MTPGGLQTRFQFGLRFHPRAEKRGIEHLKRNPERHNMNAGIFQHLRARGAIRKHPERLSKIFLDQLKPQIQIY